MADSVVLLPDTDAGRLSSCEVVLRKMNTIHDVLPAGDDVAIRAIPGDTRQPLTFAQLQAFVTQLDIGKFGLGHGSRLCTSVPNGPELAVLFLASIQYCTSAPLNIKLTAAEIAFEFEDMPAAACVVQRGEDNAVVLDLCARMNVLALELVPSLDHIGEFELARLDAESVAPPPPPRRETAARSDVALVLHTSGTTAKPKIVPLHHENIAGGVLQIASCLPLDGPSSVNLNVMPLYHIHAISINLLASLVSGSSCLVAPGPLPQPLLTSWLQASPPPTWYSSVPTIHGLILSGAEALGLTASGAALEHSLKFARSESSMLPVLVGQRLEALFGLNVSQTYAMTESMPISANPIGPTRKLPTVGFSAGPAIRLCDDAGVTQPRGQEGEVCVCGVSVTVGYELRPHMKKDSNIEAFHTDATVAADAIERGDREGLWLGFDANRAWLRTGDKGYIDADGHLQLVGRFKEILNRGGEKISPFAIENELRRHPAVRDLIVFACPHAELGEVAGVAVVPHMPCTLTLGELRDHGAAAGLASKWLPEYLVFIEKVPTGSTGKPSRIGLAAKLGVKEISAAALAPGEGAANGGGGPAAYDSLALPSSGEGGAAAGAPEYSHFSGLTYTIVLFVVFSHFCPQGTAASTQTGSHSRAC